MSSVNIAGSFGDAPYTVVDDLTTSRRTSGAFWHAASSCMVPMTLTSFIDVRPPACRACASTLMCTTVSTPRAAITLAMTGLRMSARTNSAPPEVGRRRDDVDADDALDRRGRCGEPAREPAAEVAGRHR